MLMSGVASVPDDIIWTLEEAEKYIEELNAKRGRSREGGNDGLSWS